MESRNLGTEAVCEAVWGWEMRESEILLHMDWESWLGELGFEER